MLIIIRVKSSFKQRLKQKTETWEIKIFEIEEIRTWIKRIKSRIDKK